MSMQSRPSGVRATLALSCVGTMLIPLAAVHAQDKEQTLTGVAVTATAVDEEPGRQQASPKSVRPILDTPQTITVLSKDVLQQQNLLSLKDALSTVPGISFGAGEGGSGYGDSITLRGYSANNDITVDGVRDSAQYSRTDTFNIEQIEVTNGASSVQQGSGSVGGNINLVTKRPTDRDQSIIQGGVGTADYFRGTIDVNQHLTDSVVVRLNAMGHKNDVPGRSYEYAKRWGVMPEITVGMGSPTRLTAEWFHQEDHNIPQFGVPYFSSAVYTGPLPGVDRSDYYGFRGYDTQRINADQFNLILDHDFTDKISIRNLTRYQDITQLTRTDGPEGTFCLPTGFTAIGVACTTRGLFTPSGGSRGNLRDTRNRLYYNQTDLKGTATLLGFEHTFDLGVSISQEKYNNISGNAQRNANGSTLTLTPYPIYNPDAANVYSYPYNFIQSQANHSRINNQAIYLFDAVKLGAGFELNGGVRWEHNSGRAQQDVYSTVVGATLGTITRNPTLRNTDKLFSYRAGLVYKPVDTASLYIAYGNSKTPSQSTVNSGCTNTAATATAAASSTCSVRPEGAKNYEVGGKVELFDGGLLLTAALFRNERDSYKVPSGDPTVPDQQTDGKSRVDGLSLGASGHVTPAWSITTNYTYLKSKLIQSVSSKCLAAPGTGSCTNTVAVPNPGGGSELIGTPKHSGSLYTAYTLPFGLTLGYGATYQGSFAINTPTAAIPQSFRSKSYLIHNATITYDISKRFQAQVNVKNIGDKLYYTRIRTTASSWATPGDARSAVLTLTYKM